VNTFDAIDFWINKIGLKQDWFRQYHIPVKAHDHGGEDHYVFAPYSIPPFIEVTNGHPLPAPAFPPVDVDAPTTRVS
jgi:hypothetical protein